ncbi:hypothetical protein J3B02_001877 [Coemansia erecta]|uniref:Uncharacterized protein n=1 Tax=Coemansia asiatica TaxID=1052880 RepID=A0A9W8CIJ1_9FUNG|nr:hypothetical protein LPJ64_003715 [Coemansia asiatica]KAJ2855965.1 hypothetical protein J3B02_001877 [Coemansia erecta]KAJ2888914.1 hypothetical protein FB639_000287 [Coemansia asiatica]
MSSSELPYSKPQNSHDRHGVGTGTRTGRATSTGSTGSEAADMLSQGSSSLAAPGGLSYGGWATQPMMGVGSGGSMGSGPIHRSVSRRSSVVSTASASFFDRSFFSTPESRIMDHGKKTTLAYATLMLNIYNNISLDLKTSVEANRRIVVQTVASKNKAAQLAPDLGRVHADIEDAISTTASISRIDEFASIKELLCHSLQVYEDIRLSSLCERTS